MCSAARSFLSGILPGVPFRYLFFLRKFAATLFLLAILQISVAAQEIGDLPASATSDGSHLIRPGTLSQPLTAPANDIVVFPAEKGPHAASVTVAQLAVPGKAQKALRKAWDALRKGRTDDARTEIAEALALWPRYSEALAVSAILCLLDRQPDPALDAAQRAVKLDPTNGMAYIVLAAARNLNGQYDEALHAAESGLRYRPDAWQGYFERARAEFAKKQFASALADVTRAGELASDKTSVIHFLKGAALLNLNRRSDAVLELQAYLRMNPAGAAADRARTLIDHLGANP
jgi:tetratricopeptide (TPR) repeat protein